MTYTTQDLIEILDRELKANWKGKRVVLSSAERINDPVVTKLLDMNRVNKVFAYQDFRKQIHQYQLEHQVSGIIWCSCSFNAHQVHYPEIHNQLIPLPTDKAVLVAAKQSVIEFWNLVTPSMQFWLANAPGRSRTGEARTRKPNNANSNEQKEPINPSPPYQAISPAYVAKLINQAEWAEIDSTKTEIYLGLCWGDPAEYRYQWAKPKSGCDRLIASHSVPSSIKI